MTLQHAMKIIEASVRVFEADEQHRLDDVADGMRYCLDLLHDVTEIGSDDDPYGIKKRSNHYGKR